MQAPDFTLPDQNGDEHSLKDYAGKWLVLYFYPKDDTPGCTTEACAFRDGRDMLAELGAEVVGVSKDTTRSHAKFAEHYGLNFTILSDRSGEVIKAYGSWRPKTMFGREFFGINRDTFLISPQGEIVKKYEGVDPAIHIKEVYADLKQQVL
jgi:peroxiredoxin Q/BCP